MSYCDTCIHHDVCGVEGVDDEAMTYCADRIESCEDAISRQAVDEIINDIRDCVSVEGYWAILERMKKLPPVTPQPKMGHCRDCKWWKDSDGLYRRGSHAESRCPINRREVFEGNGYCYMFESQESEDKE